MSGRIRAFATASVVVMALLLGLVAGRVTQSPQAAAQTAATQADVDTSICESVYVDSILVTTDDPRVICKIPAFYNVGSACPNASTVDQVRDLFNKTAGRNLAGTWKMVPEGNGPAFQFTATEPQNIPVPFGVLEVEGRYHSAGMLVPVQYGAVWRCLTAKGMGVTISNPSAPVPPKPTAVCMSLSDLKALGNFVTELKDSGKLAGAVIELKNDWAPPSEGWVVQYQGATVPRGYKNQVVSIWAPDSCRPLKP